ncbi:MAG: hypothetical protein AUK44_01740 [Porphyromonadaceae bacterium CG2_30_38_12]|nr:MAG: hypothetical protein AUK44_01740 [Porphyromonadaceae bacterium CG2_30_38_12]
MKKLTLTAFLILITIVSWSQLITTNPIFVTETYSGEIEITYDATKGTAGLKDYIGTDGVYAHIGVITNNSASNSDWKHAPVWGDNSAKYKLTSLGNNLWKFIITPNMTSYFGLTTGEVVKKFAMVFRNGLKTKEGKDIGGTDIFVSLYSAGLNVAFTNPTINQSISIGSTIDFSVSSSISADIELFMNGNSIKTANTATTLTHSQLFDRAGDYIFIAAATQNNVTVYDTVNINVPEAVTNQVRPSGLTTGINYIDNSTVTLVLHAPNKSNVFLIGDFNDWSQLNAYQLKKDGEYWWITLTGLTPGKLYGFQYLVDGSTRISDPYTEMVLDPWNDKWVNEKTLIYPNLKAYPDGKTDGVAATFQTAKPSYNWEVSNFVMPSRENMIIYELLLRDFTPEKSLEAAISKLDYLKNLGITAIELMPIQEFDGNNSWGYNPNHYFAPDKAYGTADMYKKFIDESHKRGIAVFLDIVLNHASGLSPFAKLFYDNVNYKPTAANPWMNENATHPYSVLNDFNHAYSGTKEHFKRMVQYWINEYKIDGYRLDLTKGLTQHVTLGEPNVSAYDQSRIDNITAYYNAAKAVKPDVMFILEHFCEYSEESALANKGMYLWRKVNDAFSQSAMGIQSNSDFGGMISSPRQWVGYAESHDEERNFYKAALYGDGSIKTDSLVRIARVPLNIAFTTLLPGPKMLWEFQEMGYDKSINSNGGRTNEKSSAWGYLNLSHRKAAYDASSKIITLRKMYPTAFTQGTFSTQVGSSDWSAGKRIALTHSDLNMVVLGNFQNTSALAYPNFPKTGLWYNLFTGASVNISNTNNPMAMQAGDLMIFTDRQIQFTNKIKNISDTNNAKVFPTVTRGKLIISGTTGNNTIEMYNLQGEIVLKRQNASHIDISNFNSGIYFVQVSDSEGTNFQKIVKQ